MTILIHKNLESRIGWIEIFGRGTPCLLKSRSRYRLNEKDIRPDKSQIKIRYTIENINNIIIGRYITLIHWKYGFQIK